MNKNLKTYSVCLFCLVLFFSCIRPRGVLSQKEMENVLFDVYLAQALSQTDSHYSASASRDSLFARVLAKYRITQADFDSSVVWYSNKGDVYSKINNHVSKRLQNFRKKFGDEDELNTKIRKKYDGFTLPPSVWIGGRGFPSFFGFEIDSLKFMNNTVDTTAFDFNFKTLGIVSKSSAYAEVCFKYKDTIVKERQIISDNTIYSIKKPLNIKRKLKRISGYIRVEDSPMQMLPVFVYELHYKKVKTKPKPKSDVKSETELPKKSEEKRPVLGPEVKNMEKTRNGERIEKVDK